MDPNADTIAAIATPPGNGGVAIIRISGPKSTAIAQALLKTIPSPRYAQYSAFYDCNQQIIDYGIALYFPNPHSFTGEEVIELQCHGGQVISQMILAQVIKNGARQAKPGEFSERAYLNNKIDLIQAEAIADLIESSSEQAARSALCSLTGIFSKRINELLEKLTHLRIYTEAAIDFPEEEVDFINDGKIETELNNIILKINEIQANARQGKILRDGLNIVFAGRPNVGKSSLLNALSGQDSAIVTAIAGTTRDCLKEYILIDNIPIHIIDTAGLRQSDDIIEQEGIRRSWESIKTADAILMITDDENAKEDQHILNQLPNLPTLIIQNKIDLRGETERIEKNEQHTTIYLSAKKQQGLALLKDQLKHQLGYDENQTAFGARQRHLTALSIANKMTQTALAQFLSCHAGELLAEDLRLIHDKLGEITGAISSDDLLGLIFSNFCIGK